jgi:hypothetical protein
MVDDLGVAADALRLVVGSVTEQRLLIRPMIGSYLARFTSPAPLAAVGLLRGGALGVSLVVRRDERTGQLTTASYFYSLLDHSSRELMAFHWHPASERSLIGFPHLHVSAALRGMAPNGDVAILPLDKVHVPTGHLSLADVVRLLVAELGVRPRVASWEARLERARAELPRPAAG